MSRDNQARSSPLCGLPAEIAGPVAPRGDKPIINQRDAIIVANVTMAQGTGEMADERALRLIATGGRPARPPVRAE